MLDTRDSNLLTATVSMTGYYSDSVWLLGGALLQVTKLLNGIVAVVHCDHDTPGNLALLSEPSAMMKGIPESRNTLTTSKCS
jgi:hypothetical protein